tara:strand:- start:1181 stop:1603 length:423 start_codon:yes stop_codon:yes gene_type:complete
MTIKSRKRLHGKRRRKSALKQSNPYTDGTTNSVDMSNMTAEERKLLMQGFKRKAKNEAADRQAAREPDKKTQHEKNLEFVKNSTNTILRGEDPLSQAFGLVAGAGVGGALSKAAQARNLPVVKKTIDWLGKVKKLKTLGG